MASSTTKPVAIGERHERQVVQAVPEQVHDAERTDERQRHRHARNERRAHVPEEREDDDHDEDDRDDERLLDVADRRAHRLGAVAEDLDLDALRDDAFSCGSSAFTRSATWMTFAPCCRWMLK